MLNARKRRTRVFDPAFTYPPLTSIDMDFWRVLATQNDRVTMMIVMFVVKCRFSMETSKAVDLFENWATHGGDV